MAVFLFIVLFLILSVTYKNYKLFDNFKADYPCKVFLSDNDFLKHIIFNNGFKCSSIQKEIV